MAFGRKTGFTTARNDERRAVAIPATVRLGTGERLPIQIEDLSASGLRATIASPMRQGMLLRVGLPIGRSPHARVVWYEGDQMGCAFLANIDRADLAALIADVPEAISA